MAKLVVGERPVGKPNTAAVAKDQKDAVRIGGKMIDEDRTTKVKIYDIEPKKGK